MEGKNQKYGRLEKRRSFDNDLDRSFDKNFDKALEKGKSARRYNISGACNHNFVLL